MEEKNMLTHTNTKKIKNCNLYNQVINSTITVKKLKSLKSLEIAHNFLTNNYDLINYN